MTTSLPKRFGGVKYVDYIIDLNDKSEVPRAQIQHLQDLLNLLQENKLLQRDDVTAMLRKLGTE